MDPEIFYSHIGKHLQQELPLVIYRKPGAANKIKALLQQDSAIFKLGNFSESGFVFSPFDQAKTSIVIPLEQAEFLECAPGQEIFTGLVANPGFSLSENETALSIVSHSDKVDHLQLIKKAIGRLKTSEMAKVVLSRREEVPLNGKHPLILFQELVLEYPSAFTYCWYHPAVGLWLGATPETLVELNGLNFKTMALAGTQKFNGETDVSWGVKEQQEQQYVTDSILEDLKETGAIQEIKISDAYTTRAGGLLHLRTDISGRIKSGEDLWQIVGKLHPTPAVCGLPKETAREFILKEETYDREFYTGFLGELNFQERKMRSRSRRNTENLAYVAFRKSTDLYVNLRCMKLEGEKAVLFIGGGITKDSIPEDEWQETVNKSQTMKRVLEK